MKILIVGGTGTLGRALIKHYSKSDHQIFCLSRDELKQQEIKKLFPKVKCVLGDIRHGIPYSLSNIDLIYHVAALKHIDVIEDNIKEALRTNVTGTINVAEYAINSKVPKVAFSSTDKAVYPINIYGNTKSIGERYLQNLNETQETTDFRVFRWGNVIGSRGSVIHAFKESLLKEKTIYLTHPDMTRFWIRLENAIKFLVDETERPTQKGVLIPKMRSAKVSDIAMILANKLGIASYKTVITGLRPGEKIHEDIDRNLNSYNSERYTGTELYDLLQDIHK